MVMSLTSRPCDSRSYSTERPKAQPGILPIKDQIQQRHRVGDLVATGLADGAADAVDAIAFGHNPRRRTQGSGGSCSRAVGSH
jgi:hypothetical protein